MISLFLGVAYGEAVWWSIETGKNTLSRAKSFAWGMVIFNFVLAILSGSVANLELGIVISLYAVVIFNLRGKNDKSKS